MVFFLKRNGQALITVISFLSIMLFLGMILFSHAIGIIQQTNALADYSSEETSDQVMAELTYLVLNDAYTNVIDDALNTSRIGSEPLWNISVFDNRLDQGLALLLNTQLGILLADSATDILDKSYAFSVNVEDWNEAPLLITITGTTENRGVVITMLFELHKPVLTDPDNLGTGEGTYLSGTEPLIGYRSLDY